MADDAEEDIEAAGGGDEGGAGADVPAWLSALHPTLPEMLYAPYDPDRRRFCFRKLGKCEDAGLIVFSTSERARSYAETFLVKRGFVEVQPVTLDEARDIAIAHPVWFNCVALVDDPRRPVVLTVR